MIAEDINTHMLSTYVSLRRLIVVVTLAFLVTLSAYRLSGHERPNRNSISAYYHHDNTGFRMKDVFIGALTSVALLLIAYQGYTDREKWALDIAGIALLGVVAFPMDWPSEGQKSSPTEIAHYAAAAVFYLAVSYVCLLRAHDTLGAMRNEQRKAMFKQAYRLTGLLLLAIPVTTLALRQFAWWLYGVEYAGVIVFMAYWLIKSFELRLTQLETEERLKALAAAAVPKERSRPAPPIPQSES